MRANQKDVFVIRKMGSETYWNHHMKDVVGLRIQLEESGDATILDLRGRSTIDGGESELLSNQLQKPMVCASCCAVARFFSIDLVSACGLSLCDSFLACTSEHVSHRNQSSARVLCCSL